MKLKILTNLRPLVLKIHVYYQIEPAQDMSGQDAAQSGRGYTAQVFFQSHALSIPYTRDVDINEKQSRNEYF